VLCQIGIFGIEIGLSLGIYSLSVSVVVIESVFPGNTKFQVVVFQG
jgi:hypothetical protein